MCPGLFLISALSPLEERPVGSCYERGSFWLPGINKKTQEARLSAQRCLSERG